MVVWEFFRSIIAPAIPDTQSCSQTLNRASVFYLHETPQTLRSVGGKLDHTLSALARCFLIYIRDVLQPSYIFSREVKGCLLPLLGMMFVSSM